MKFVKLGKSLVKFVKLFVKLAVKFMNSREVREVVREVSDFFVKFREENMNFIINNFKNDELHMKYIIMAADDIDGGVVSKWIEEGSQSPHVKKESSKDTNTSVKEWMENQGWGSSPFTLNIDPALFVGYKEESRKILDTIEEGHKLAMVVGPTGSGKTTLLKWLMTQLSDDYVVMFLSKPPDGVDEFVEIFREKFKRPWYLRLFFSNNIKNIYQVPEFLNNELGDKHLVILCDEIHEADKSVLEWLRVLTDQVDNMTAVISGLPVFRKEIKENLETLQKRIMCTVELISLTKKEMVELMKKRIKNAGGEDLRPFTQEVIEMIYQETGGFPREVIRVCSKMVNEGIKKGQSVLGPKLIEKKEKEIKEEESLSLDVLDKFTPMQKRIVNALAEKSMSPGEIADTFDLEKYKSRQHAVRSVNNILTKLAEDDFIKRERQGRTFVYRLSPKIKTMVVKG